VLNQTRAGKTCFLFYTLFRRLSEGLPTAFQVHSKRFFLFTEDGPEVVSCLSSNTPRIPSGTWALSDSSDTILQPCDEFLDDPELWVIQASSPKAAQWKRWQKQRSARLYVMDPTSEAELLALG
jgi:hypothetical protein